MNQFSVIEVNDTRWIDFLSKSKQYDFYHTPCYHLLEKTGKPLLFVAEYKKNFIALPLIVRNIEGTNYMDCTSVYGYCGPVSNIDLDKIPPELSQYFRIQLNQYFKNNNIITAFSRLHPIINGDILFKGMGTIKHINQTVAINLKLPLEEQKKEYRKSTKSEINQLRRKKGYYVREAEDDEDLNKFISLYHETMKRVNANKNYFFDKTYFFSLLRNNCFVSKLLLAIKEDKITAGAIFTITNKIMQYHLAGTKVEHISETPMKLIIDQARLIGNELNLEYLHLGGGVGGNDKDSLFHFKAGFSNCRFSYKTWQYIVNEEEYKELCNLRVRNERTIDNFFPLYRVM